MKKNNNNYIEVMVISKTLANQWSENDMVKWFTTIIQPAVERQELYVKKIFKGTLTNLLPVYLS
ncbi:hypothetical protein A4H97_15470 [Niastella yeongjuensis]|uniref:Uncharacterized protein n=1 Tax=Niastella yeongjuensis TaxID=354355 RepID=A0A1V9E4G1_9BACT|nr:hypothetical protein [Niastella yeongjuensis]OQP40998.1 hypothetical protein A4H97_15470 [Niastella yeongjuensis]SEO95298.1 hypothetical protein SAMN05660816_03955 [Niastella yeongjuensis]